MRKHLILTLLLCFSAAAAIAGTETRNYGLDVTHGWGYNATLTGKMSVTFTSNYGEFELTDKIIRSYENSSWSTTTGLSISDYTGIKILCSEVNNVQLKVEYEDMAGLENSDLYPQLKVGEATELTFATGHGNVTLLALQDNGSGSTTASSVVVEEAYLIKAGDNGETEALNYTSNYGSWGYSTCVSYSPTISYTAQYGENYITNEDGTPFTFDSSNADTYTFTVTFAEALPIDMMVETRYIDGNSDEQHLEYLVDYGNGIKTGATSATFTIGASNVTDHDIAYIKFKANSSTTNSEGGDTYPAVVKFASITATVTGDDIQGDFDNYFTLPKNVALNDHSLLDTGTNFTTESGTENTYDADDRTITFGSAYAGYGWWLGGYDEYEEDGETKTGNRLNVEDYSIYQGIEVAFKTTAKDDELIQLVVEYFRDEDCTEGDIVSSAAYTLGTGDGENFGTGQTLYIDFSQTYASRMYQIYIQNGNSSGTKIQLLGARLIPKSNDDEEYSYKVNLAGYATSNWNSSGGDVITINELDGTDFLGTADLTFTSGYSDNTIGLGWHNWGNTGDGAFNLAQFDEVRISYEVTSKDTEDDVTVQALFNNTNYGEGEGTNVNIVQKDSNEDGVITLTIAAGSFTDDSGTEVDDFDWTHVGQFVIQASGACTVKITSIEFWRDVRTAPAEQTIDLTTSDGNTITSRTGGTIKVSGDGSSTGDTFSFPLNATGTYDIYIADGTKINTKVGESNLNAGITIPRGVTVNLYIEGEASVTGSTYGIYAMSGSDLTIYTVAKQSVVDTNGEFDSETTSDLTINADYGIYFLGSNFNVYGLLSINYKIFVYTMDQERGKVTVNAKYCGIYFSQEFTGYEIKGTDLDIEVSGNDTDITEETTIEPKYICGIYNASNTMFCLSVGTFVINVPGTGTYGTFSNTNSGLGFYFGFGTFIITATKCVLHHPDGTQYSGGYLFTDDDPFNGNYVYYEFYGPFCAHYEYTDIYGNVGGTPENPIDVYWFCDGSYGTVSSASGSTLNSNATYRANDEAVLEAGSYDGYNVDKANEMEYYNRTLYKGWNTLCLPADYDLSATTAVDENYDGVEARDVISRVATFTSLMSAEDYEAQYGSTTDGDTNNAKRLTTVNDLDDEENVDDNDDSTDDTPDYTFYLTFTYVDTDANPTLTAGTPYLVYVEDPMAGSTSQTSAEDGEEGNATSYADGWKVLAHFTSMSKDLKHVNDDKGNGLKTVYHAEIMQHDGEISSDSDSDDTFYYKLYNPSIDQKKGESYFNRPRENKTATVGAFRAYLDASELDNTSAQSLSIIFDDGTTTSIEELDGGVNAENSRVRVYSVDGKLIKVAGASEATKGLARGVYVVDGKKVVVM